MNMYLQEEKIVDYQDLTIIKGIGPQTQLRLNDVGIFTVSQLKNTPIKVLSSIKGIGVSSAEKLINSTALVLNGTQSVYLDEELFTQTSQVKEQKTLSTKKALIYVLPNVGFTALLGITVNFILLFYINIMGQPAIITGIIYSISLCLFAFSSIVWGVLADKIGKKKVLWISGISMAFLFVLIWIPPTPTSSQSYGSIYLPLIIWLIVFSFLFRITAAGFQSSLYALLPELSTNSKNRVKISMLNTLMTTLGFIVGMIGPIVMMSLATQNFNRKDSQLYFPNSPTGRMIATQIFHFSIAIIIVFLVCLVLMQSVIKEKSNSNSTYLGVSEVLRNIAIPFRDKNFRKWLMTYFFFWTPFVAFQYLLLNIATFMLKLRGNEFIILISVALTTAILSFVVWQKLAIKIGLIKALSICLMSSSIGFFLMIILTFPMTQLIVFILGVSLISILVSCLVGAMIFPLAISSNLIERAEIKTGNSLSGSYYGTISMILALGSAVAMLFVSIFLQILKVENLVTYGTIMAFCAVLIIIAVIILRRIRIFVK